MDNKTITIRALRASIVKWEMLRDFARGLSPMPCPLCLAFKERGCVDCPLYEVGTPKCGEGSDTVKAIDKLLGRLREELAIAEDEKEIFGD